jgi:hypothetical protein
MSLDGLRRDSMTLQWLLQLTRPSLQVSPRKPDGARESPETLYPNHFLTLEADRDLQAL